MQQQLLSICAATICVVCVRSNIRENYWGGISEISPISYLLLLIIIIIIITCSSSILFILLSVLFQLLK